MTEAGSSAKPTALPGRAAGSFGASVVATRCPYAGLAVWQQIGVPARLINEHGVALLERVGRDIRDRIVTAVADELDMLAVEVDHPSVIGGLDPLTRAVALFVRGLLGEDALPKSGSEAEWVAYVHGERLFVFTLCPFYDERHPRQSSTESAFIVIQFLNSFRKINMHRMTLADKKRLSDKVKAVFTAAGLDYFAYITQGPAEALKMVKPMHQGQDPIRWWQML